MSWIDDKISDYLDWIKDNTIIHEKTGTSWVQLSTPYIGLFNDGINIYVKNNQDGTYSLSDDCETIRNLQLCGYDTNKSEKRRELINMILLNYGVSIDSNEIIVKANSTNFPKVKHNFISALLEINDLGLLVKNQVSSLFAEDVSTYLNDLGLTVIPQFLIRGESGLEASFDFLVSNKSSETIIKPYNSFTQTSVERFLFSWTDVKTVRAAISKKNLSGIAIINDTEEKNIRPEFIQAVINKGAYVMPWSDKNDAKWTDFLAGKRA